MGSPGERDLEGAVDIYVRSHDRPVRNFAHLNVTATGVAFVPSERANGGGTESTGDGDTGGDTSTTGTETPTATAAANETTTGSDSQ